MVDGHVVDAAHLEDLKVQLSLKDVEVAKLLNDLQVSVFFKRFLFVADVVAKNYPRFFCRHLIRNHGQTLAYRMKPGLSFKL
jgi:hypothetical protein